MMSQQRGLTLVELLITLGVISILMSVAMPSFQNFNIRNNSVAQVSDLMTDLQFARNEASKIGSTIRVCVGNSTGCRPAWSDSWNRGWAVTVNGTGTVLRVHPAVKNGNTVQSNNATTTVSQVDFNRYGFTTSHVFKFCNELNQARALLLSRTGKIKLATDTDDPKNALVDDENNNDITCP